MDTNVDESQWVRACKLKKLEDGEGVRVQMPGGGKKDAVALFLHKGRLFALEDRCCHADKSLHGGDIEDLGKCVVGEDAKTGIGGLCVQCPRHQRKFAGGLYFNLETGEACTPEYTKKFGKLDKHTVDVHDVRVESGIVYVSRRPRQTISKTDAPIVIADDDDIPENRASKRLCSIENDIPRADVDDDKLRLVLTAIKRINHDSLEFVFTQVSRTCLPRAPSSPVWHVAIFADINGKAVEREYTPVSDWAEWAESLQLRLLVKIYPDGLMTQYLASLSVGDQIISSPPRSTLLVPCLRPAKHASISGVATDTWPSHTVLVAAGTGIVPMIQIIQVLTQAKSAVKSITLVYGSRSQRDLLCCDELRILTRNAQELGATKLRLWLAFSDADADGMVQLDSSCVAGLSSGRIDTKVFQEALAPLPPEARVHVIISGPDGFYNTMTAAVQDSGRFKADAFVDLDA